MRSRGTGPAASWGRLLVVLAVAGGLSLALAGTASAHAVLERTTPIAGAVVTHEPAEVTLIFGESVGVNRQDIQVFDDQLHRVTTGGAGHLSGRGATVGVRLPPGLRNGTYTVTWRVISADSHPVSGGFTFSIGARSRVNGTPAGLGGGSRTVGVLLGATRFLGYASLIAGPGGLAFLLIWPGGLEDRPARRLILGGCLTGIVSAAGQFLLQAPYAQGESLTRTVNGALLDAVAHSHFGRVVALRFLLWVLVAAAAALVLSGRRAGRGLAVVSCLALMPTWALAGHGDDGSHLPLALASESIHVLAVTVWLGGLLVLSARVLRAADRQTVYAVLPRFSAVALWCVSAILITGFYQAWREVGLSWTALVTTTYGRIVGLKILSIAALIGLGGFARWKLGAVAAVADAPEATRSLRGSVVQGHLRQSVLVELGIGVGVLVLTSILVNTVPAKDAVSYPERGVLTAPGLRVDATVTPARVGTDTISLEVFTAEGRPQPVTVRSGALSLPARHIASLPVTFATTKGSNHATASLALPLAGQWTLSFETQTSPVDATEFTTTFTVH